MRASRGTRIDASSPCTAASCSACIASRSKTDPMTRAATPRTLSVSMRAQGEDVVAGIRTPRKIAKGTGGPPEETLEAAMPNLYGEFLSIAHRLEDHFNDMQDIEFTIQEGKLYLLQTRSGKRSGKAALRI